MLEVKIVIVFNLSLKLLTFCVVLFYVYLKVFRDVLLWCLQNVQLVSQSYSWENKLISGLSSFRRGILEMVSEFSVFSSWQVYFPNSYLLMMSWLSVFKFNFSFSPVNFQMISSGWWVHFLLVISRYWVHFPFSSVRPKKMFFCGHKMMHFITVS